MDTKKIWHRISCTSVGLYRMGREAVTAFFDRAFEAGRPQSTVETATAREATSGEEDFLGEDGE